MLLFIFCHQMSRPGSLLRSTRCPYSLPPENLSHISRAAIGIAPHRREQKQHQCTSATRFEPDREPEMAAGVTTAASTLSQSPFQNTETISRRSITSHCPDTSRAGRIAVLAVRRLPGAWIDDNTPTGSIHLGAALEWQCPAAAPPSRRQYTILHPAAQDATISHSPSVGVSARGRSSGTAHIGHALPGVEAGQEWRLQPARFDVQSHRCALLRPPS